MSQLVPFGKNTFVIPLIVKDSGGSLANADSLPTVLNVQKNGADADEASVTVAQAQNDTPANITGVYNVSVDLSSGGLNAAVNDQFTIVVEATVGGTTVPATFTFTVADLAGNMPSIDLG